MKKQIAIVIILLLGIAVSVFLSQRQQIFKSRASLQAYSAFNVASGEPGKYVSCSGNVCETNTLNITISVADLQALNIQDQQVAAGKTDEQCKQELGEPPPFCDLNNCIKNKPVAKDNQCRFDIETVDLALCPNNCQSNGTQTFLCSEVETCQKYSSGPLTGKLIKYWRNEIGGIEGCQAPQEIEDVTKCPTGQTLSSGQYTAIGGGLTGQISAGSAPIAKCSVQDYATPCWMGADCKEENQTYANHACSNNRGAGSKCTRSTGASNAFEDGCTQPESTAAADSCSGQYITACWQGADCKEENQASANAVCSQNHGPESVCTRATGMGNVFEDGCTYGTSSQIAAGIKQTCSAENFATSCWIEARCDETNQRFADRTCVNSHGEGSACTRSTGAANTNDDGCTKTVVDVAQARRARAAQNPACNDIEECDEETGRKKIYPCGQQPAIEIEFDASCIPDLTPEKARLALDLNLESKRLAKKQEAEKQDKPFWEKAGDLAGGLWSGIISLGKGIQEAPTQGEVGQANRQAIAKNFQSLFGEGQRNAEVDQEQLQKLLECQANYKQAIREGKNPEDIEDCSSVVPQVTQKSVDKKAAEAEACALESGDVKTCLSKTGVNMDVGEAKIAKTGICLNLTYDPNARCIGFTGESVVPADASQNLSEVLRKAEVVKLAEELGLKLDENPNLWEKEKREFFFNAAARTDINAAKFAAEFFGIPITAWENADKAAKICARDHKFACFVDSSMPASSWIQSASNEQIDQLNQISQNYFRGFEPAPPELLRKYGYLVDVNALNQTGKQFGKPLEISAEDWDKVLRTFRVYAQTGDNIKNNTAAGRLYQEKQTQAVVESYIGLVSTVVDPMPAAQALSSGLKYVVVKQVWNRLSDRFGSKVASEIAQNAEKAIARGAVATAAEREALRVVNDVTSEVASKEGLAGAEKAAEQSIPDEIRAIVENGGVEPPAAVKAVADARVDPEVQRTAAQGIERAHNGSGRLDGQEVVIPDSNAGFVTPDVPTGNPVEAVQNGVNGLVEDAGRLLRREEPTAPVVEVAERAAEPYSNPVLARVAEGEEAEAASLGSVGDGLANTERKLAGEPPAEAALPDVHIQNNGVMRVGEPPVELADADIEQGVRSFLQPPPNPTAGEFELSRAVSASGIEPKQTFDIDRYGFQYLLTDQEGTSSRKVYFSFKDQQAADDFLTGLKASLGDFEKNKIGLNIKQIGSGISDEDMVLYLLFDPLEVSKGKVDDALTRLERVIEETNRSGQRVVTRGRFAEDPEGLLIGRRGNGFQTTSFIASKGTSSSNDTLLNDIKGKLTQIADKYRPPARGSMEPAAINQRILQVMDENPEARQEIIARYRSLTETTFRNPLEPTQRAAIPIAVDTSDAKALQEALATARKLKDQGYDAAVIDRSSLTTHTITVNGKEEAEFIYPPEIYNNGRFSQPHIPAELTTPVINPALDIVNEAVKGAKDLADNVGQALGVAPKELPVINGDPIMGTVKVADGQAIPFTFTDDAQRTVIANGKTYTIGGQYIDMDGNVLVPVRLENGTVAMTYLSTSEGEFKWFAGIIRDNTWFIKSDKGKDIMRIPSQLDMALKDALGDGQNGILKRLTAFGDLSKSKKEKQRFIHLMDSLGLRHDLSQVAEAGNPVDNFLKAQGIREKDITTQAAREIAGNLDYGEPVNAAWNQYAKTVDLYYQGIDPVHGPHQIKFTFSLDPQREGSYIGPVNFSLIPLDDPSAVYTPAYKRAEKGFKPTGQGVPALYRSEYGPVVKVAEKEFDEIAKLGLDSGVGKRLAELTDGFTKLPEKGDVERLMAELAGAPCPIFSLIPIAYAQGLVPCPKGPVAVLARNAGNAFKQAKNGVGGIFDRFRAPKAESGLDRIVPTTASEKAILNKAKVVEAVTDKDISLLNKAGAEVAQQAQNFDYVIVSGQSADIAETILKKQEVEPNKIIRFSVEENGDVYKIIPGQATQLTEAERTAAVRATLEKKGVNLASDKKPTFLIVDDISDTGYKATAYLDRFSQIEGVGETQYAALSALRGEVIDPSVAGTGNFVNFSRARLEELAQKTFAPSKLSPAEKLRVVYVMDNLSGVLEGNTLKNDTISYNVLVNSRITARKVLERISQQKPNPVRAALDGAMSTIQNTGKQVGDTVGGWVDNVLNKFKKKEEVSFWLESSEKYAQDAHFGQKLGSGVYSEVYDTGQGTVVKLFEFTSQTFEKKGLPDINLLQAEAMKQLSSQYPDSNIFPKFIREISAKDSQGRISLRGFEMEKIEGENLREFAGKGEVLDKDQVERALAEHRRITNETDIPFGDVARTGSNDLDLPSGVRTSNIMVTPEGEIVFIDIQGYETLGGGAPKNVQDEQEGLRQLLTFFTHPASEREQIIREAEQKGIRVPDELLNSTKEAVAWQKGLAPCPVKFGLIPVALAQGAGGFSPCPQNPLAAIWHNAQNTGRQVGDTVSGWVDNFKGIFKRGGKEEVKQLSEMETFLAQHGGIVSSLKEADTLRVLVERGDAVRAREIIEQTLKTSAHNSGAELSDTALYDLTNEIIDSHTLGRRVKDYAVRYKPEDLISLSGVDTQQPITFSTTREIPTIFSTPRVYTFSEDQTRELVQRIEEVGKNIKVPKLGIVKDKSDIIGALNVTLADPATTVGRDQRRLINILYSTPDFIDSYYTRRVNEFFEAGGKSSDLPSLFADLLAENKSRYDGFRDYWAPLFDTYNKEFLPVAREKYRAHGIELAPIDPEDITWISNKELDASGRCEQGFCAIQTPVKDPRNHYFGLLLDPGDVEKIVSAGENYSIIITSGKSASEARTQSLGSILHESVHSQALHKIGIHGAIPDQAMTEVVEELTERLNITIIHDVNKIRPDLFTSHYSTAYNKERSIGDAILRHLSISEDEITRFAISQDPVGYINFIDSRLAQLDQSSYVAFVNALYQDLRIGPAQRDLFLSRRVKSVMDIREMSSEWINSLGLVGHFGSTNFQVFQKLGKEGFSLGPEEIYSDIDTFAKYIEDSRKRTIEFPLKYKYDPKYLPPEYYSETTAGRKSLNYQRPIEGGAQPNIPATGPNVLFNTKVPKNFFEQARDTVQNWFNGIFNAGKKQSLSLEAAWV